MRPYLQMRRWWRRTTPGNRVMTSAAVCLVVALLAWAFTPTGSTSSDRVSASGKPASGAAGATPSAGSSGGTSSAGAATDPAATGGAAGGGTASGATVSGESAGGGGCLVAPDGTPGVTADSISLAAAIVDLAGPIGNSAVGLGSADQLAAMAQAVIDDINARGGVQCHQLTLKTYKTNPLSQDQEHAACLQLGQDAPFLAVDIGGFANPPGTYGCVPQQQIPLVEILPLLPSEVEQFFPYIASAQGNLGSSMRTLVNGLQARGWFDASNGFKKLGLFEEDCSPEVTDALDAALANAGITDGQISRYKFQCPSGGFAAPNVVAQGVNQHRLDGVTHVIPITGSGSFNNYTQAAEGQGYRPKYAISDYGSMVLTQLGPLGDSANANNINGEIAITQTRYGQNTTPGLEPDPGTLRCQDVLTKAGFSADDVFLRGGGIVCSAIWVAEAALTHTQALTREDVLPGLFNAGTLPLAFPIADATYGAPSKVTGGDTWWPMQWDSPCHCWRVLDANRQPSWE